MNYSFDFIHSLLEKFGLNAILGLYHPNCHCKELSISKPNKNQIQLIIPEGKFDWVKKDKWHLLKAMGYNEQDFDEAMNIIQQLVKQSYVNGEYTFRIHDEKGYRIGFVINFPGKNENSGKIYKLKSGWSIFPNGKLKTIL